MTRAELLRRLSPTVSPKLLEKGTTWMPPDEWASSRHIRATGTVYQECECAVQYAAQGDWANCTWCIYAANLLPKVDDE